MVDRWAGGHAKGAFARHADDGGLLDWGMKMRLAGVIVLAAAATAMTGCGSTPEKRIAENEAVYAAMSPEAQAAVRAGRVEVGFTPPQVELARGKPDRVVRRTTAKGREQSWIYEKRGSGLGIGLGIGGGSGGLGGGVGAGTSTRGSDVSYVVNFAAGVVYSVEDYGAK